MGAIFGHLGESAAGSDRRMAEALAHRGRQTALLPLGQGFLGVVSNDTSTATATADGTSLVAHAAVYRRDPATDNATALLKALSSDTLDSLDADFALAAVRPDGTLVLARDFFGCSPLYFTRTPHGIAFASEYKALCPFMDSPEPDLDMLQHLQHAKRLPLGRTLVRGIESIGPGVTMVLSPDGSGAVRERAPLEVTGEISETEQAKSLVIDSLTAAVARRTADLDRIGLALSGGIDSIALAFLLRLVAPQKPLLTFCAGSSPDDHECVTARAVAERIRSEHVEIITPPGEVTVESLRSLVWHLEDPYSRSEALQLFEIGRAARAADCDVVLSAQGADGLFAGMPKYKLLRLMEKYPFMRTGLRQFWTYTQLGTPPSSLLGKLGVRAKFRGRVPPVPRVKGTDYSPPQPELASFGTQFINRSMARGFQAGVCQDIQKFERSFAAHNVEYRSPFYDLDFVRAAYSIDDALKIKDGQEKWILREALSGVVPEEFCRIPKFPQRIASDKSFASALDNLLASQAIRPHVEALFETHSVRGLQRSGDAAYHYEAAMRIWTVIMSSIWHDLFAGDSPSAADPESVNA